METVTSSDALSILNSSSQNFQLDILGAQLAEPLSKSDKSQTDPPHSPSHHHSLPRLCLRHHEHSLEHSNSVILNDTGVPTPTPSRKGSRSSDIKSPKPSVGSEEWLRQRRENHKEVERRRREAINEGINELAKLVPSCEKNKGSILSSAVAYIQQLKLNEATNIEKWTLEKLLTEQAISELSAQVDSLKGENEQLRMENQRLASQLDVYQNEENMKKRQRKE